MCEAPVFYATSEGQTRRIAATIAATLVELGVESRPIDIDSPEAAAVRWADVKAAVVGGSLHVGKHQSALTTFVRRHATRLNARPSFFFSVSLSIASKLPTDVEAARAIAHAFPAGTGWRPTEVICVAGRLAYTQYGWLKRYLMKRISAKAGGSTDTSRDHELTNWLEVRAFAERIARACRPTVESPQVPAVEEAHGVGLRTHRAVRVVASRSAAR